MPPPLIENSKPVGNLALAIAAGIPTGVLRHSTTIGGGRQKETRSEENGVVRTHRLLPDVYAPNEREGLFGHAVFALKHEILHLGAFTEAFKKIPPAEVGAFIASSPTGAYSRKIGFLFETLIGEDLTPHLGGATIGGNYVELLDSSKVVTAEPIRDSKWRILNNLPGGPDYIPIIERTPDVNRALERSWKDETNSALKSADGDEILIRRALNYLYVKETRSSFAIERETPSEARTARFVEALKQAGRGSSDEALSEKALTSLQNLIVDQRFAEPGFRKVQNYVGATVRWKNVVHFIPPPPEQVGDLMKGLAESVSRFGKVPSLTLAQAVVASFGTVFHHPFEDGNGRIHRYLVHDSLTRGGVINSDMALPVSAAILDDRAGYDRALEAYSKTVGEVVEFTMSDSGMLKVSHPKKVGWVWRFPDLTPQMEFFERVMTRAVSMVAEEIMFLSRYDELEKRAKAIIDMPDRRLSDLLTQIHLNNGTLSNNRRKQRFAELHDDEVKSIENAYAEVFRPEAQAESPASGPSPDEGQEPEQPRRRIKI